MTEPFSLALIGEFALRLLPGIAVIGGLLIILPRKFIEWRIVLYILLFVLFRDTMTPMRLWEVGPGVVIRLPNQPLLLLSLAVVSVVFVVAINLLEPELRRLLVWVRGGVGTAVGLGVMGALVIAAPVLLYHRMLQQQGSDAVVPAGVLLPLLLFALLGNLVEELLFRGYLQGYFEQRIPALQAAALSGFFFAAFHVFLAISVTSVGVSLLLFTLYEGILCGLLRMKGGIIASTGAHGGAIYLIASGLVG
jgi:uncharacterized protein